MIWGLLPVLDVSGGKLFVVTKRHTSCCFVPSGSLQMMLSNWNTIQMLPAVIVRGKRTHGSKLSSDLPRVYGPER